MVAPFYGNVDVIGSYEKAKQRNLDRGMQEFGVLQKILAQQQAVKEATATQDFRNRQITLLEGEAKRKAGEGQSIGAGGLRLNDGTVVPPAARPSAQDNPETLILTDRLSKMPANDPMRPYVVARLKKLGELGQGQGSAAPYYTFLPTDTGYHAGNARTGVAAPVLGVDGKPIVRATDSPRLQGDIAGARERGKAEATRAFNMSGIGQTIDKAEKLLQGIDPDTGLGTDEQTGSGFGTILDSAAGFVGYTPEGAPEADKLRAAGAALTAKMPRMEGPQSDRDVQLYKEAAGQVGDSTIPRKRRLAALQVVRGLWAKYERFNQSEFGGSGAEGGPPRVTSDAEYNALPSGTTYIGPDGKTRRKK